MGGSPFSICKNGESSPHFLPKLPKHGTHGLQRIQWQECCVLPLITCTSQIPKDQSKGGMDISTARWLAGLFGERATGHHPRERSMVKPPVTFGHEPCLRTISSHKCYLMLHTWFKIWVFTLQIRFADFCRYQINPNQMTNICGFHHWNTFDQLQTLHQTLYFWLKNGMTVILKWYNHRWPSPIW